MTDKQIETIKEALESIDNIDHNSCIITDNVMIIRNALELLITQNKPAFNQEFEDMVKDAYADKPEEPSEDKCLYSDKQCPGYVNCTYPEKETHEGLCALSPKPITDALEFWCQLVKISVEGIRTSIPIQATALITARDKLIKQDEKKLYYDIFVECLEAMQERRLYADAWEYKYKNRWDKEEAMITAVIKGIKDE